MLGGDSILRIGDQERASRNAASVTRNAASVAGHWALATKQDAATEWHNGKRGPLPIWPSTSSGAGQMRLDGSHELHACSNYMQVNHHDHDLDIATTSFVCDAQVWHSSVGSYRWHLAPRDNHHARYIFIRYLQHRHTAEGGAEARPVRTCRVWNSGSGST